MIHERLKEVYDEFDRHCRNYKVDYSIDADYYNVQGYRLLDPNKSDGVKVVLRHMTNFIKDRWIDLEYDGLPVRYEDLDRPGFKVPTYNPLFKFTLKPIQEDKNMNEDQFKQPSKSYTRKQAAFRSSFRKLKTRDTYENDGKKKPVSDSLDRSLPFDDRLASSISETVGVSMVDPEILFIRNPAEREEEPEESLEDALKAESLALQKYLAVLEQTEDENKISIVENLIDRCSQQINELNELLGGNSGTTEA